MGAARGVPLAADAVLLLAKSSFIRDGRKRCYNQIIMIALNHVLAGTAIGLAVKKPELAALLAFLSHFLLDTTPHFNYEWPKVKFMTIWVLDAIGSTAAIVFISLAAPEAAWAVIAGGIFAELPDVIWIYERLILKAQSKNWFFAD